MLRAAFFHPFLVAWAAVHIQIPLMGSEEKGHGHIEFSEASGFRIGLGCGVFGEASWDSRYI